jgi:hypothetical protein
MGFPVTLATCRDSVSVTVLSALNDPTLRCSHLVLLPRSIMANVYLHSPIRL